MKQIPHATHRPFMRILTDEQISSIHSAAMEIMCHTGIEVQDEEGLQILGDAGAVLEEGNRVKVPESMVHNALQTAPSRVVLYNQKGESCLYLEQGKTYFGPGSDTIYTLDPETGRRRRVQIRDIGNFARVCDALPNISFVMSMGNPEDVPRPLVYIHEFAQMVKNSNLPIIFCSQDSTDTQKIWEIALAVYEGDEQYLEQKPFLLNYIEPVSPLKFPKASVQKLIASAKKNIPIACPSGANAGTGAPVTLAGALAMGIAESLFGLVLQQLVRPGVPFVFGPSVSTMDQRTTIISYGCPEWSLTQGALADMGRFYNLPTWSYAGATDSKRIDAQAGIEATFSVVTCLACRCNLVHDVGYIEYGTTSSLEQLVMANEIIDMARFFMEGFEINSEWHPQLMDRLNYSDWKEKGALTMEDRLRSEVNRIISTHKPEPKPDYIIKEIDTILEAGI